jgi:alpha-mannosidase
MKDKPKDTGTAAPGEDHTLWFIPHTHWEGAVFKTREEYLDIGLPFILKALKLLKTWPDYRFVLDQVCYVKPFLERYPEESDAFRRFVRDGRLQIVCGTDCMPDVNMPCGESFIRQVLYGKSFYRDELDVDVTVGWQLDTFGHHAQMPQLLKLAGYESFWFFRGVSSWDVPSEFLWEGLDGTQIPAFWLSQGYAPVYGSPESLPEFAEFLNEKFELLGRWSPGTDRVALSGRDVSEPEEHVPPLVEEFNQQDGRPFTIRIGVPTDFEAVVEQSGERTVVHGELNPIFQGTYSSRIELKQWTRDLERLLTTAEKLGVLCNLLGRHAGDDNLWDAWEPVLFNHAHDLMSGVMTDRVYEDTVRSFDFSKRLANEAVGKRLDTICSCIDTEGDGIPLVVFNTLDWPRTDVAEAELGFSDNGVRAVEVLSPEGEIVPVQIAAASRYEDGSMRRARIAFVAEVPALGHAVYRAVPSRAEMDSPTAERSEQTSGVIENEHYRVAVNLSTGEMTELFDKMANWQVMDGVANVIARQHDAGDFWELYKPLDGGSRIAMTDRQPVPQPGEETKFSNEEVGDPGSVITGPVFSEIKVAHPFGGEGGFATVVRLYAGSRRIEIRSQIFNAEKFVRYQALFTTSIKDGRSVHEIPFGAIERPAGIEFPAQNWADYSDDENGVAVLNRGLPGNLVTDGTLMLSLMRSTRIVAYGFSGGYERGMSSDTGFELNKELTFDYALVPHGGDWKESKIYRQGLEFNQPLIVRKTLPHAGDLPKRWGLLEVSHPNCVVSALKPGKDGATVLRVYEPTGEPAAGVKIRFDAKLSSACEANLMEDPSHNLVLTDDALSLDLAPFEIKTFMIGFDSNHIFADR